MRREALRARTGRNSAVFRGASVSYPSARKRVMAWRAGGVRCELGKCFAAVRKTASVRTRTVSNGARTAVLTAFRKGGGC